MKCGYHPEREAVGTCVGCGRGICEFCKTILNDKLYCPTCAEKGIMEPEKSQKPIISEQATKDGAKAQPQSTGISSNNVNIPSKKTPSKSTKWIALVVVLAIFVGITVFFMSCTGSCVNTIANSPDNEDLVILNYHATTTEYGSYQIVGTAQNTGDKEMAYAEVEVKFYGSGGVLLDTWIDNINNLGAGETWSFEVLYMGSGTPVSYTIAPGTVW